MVDLSAPTPFLPNKRLYSRTRVVGKPGFPGKGMGGTLILPSENEFHPLADFKFNNDYTYSFRPKRIDLGMQDGELYPTHFAYTQRYASYRKLGEKVATQPPARLGREGAVEIRNDLQPSLKLGSRTLAFVVMKNQNRRVAGGSRQLEKSGESDQAPRSDQIPVQIHPNQPEWAKRTMRLKTVTRQAPEGPVDSKISAGKENISAGKENAGDVVHLGS
jgi:hypothetical protein